MTTTTVSVKTTRDFYDQDKREWVNAGSALEVDRARAVDLRQNGLIEEFEAKAAEEPENKKAPTPKNKAAGKSGSAEE